MRTTSRRNIPGSRGCILKPIAIAILFAWLHWPAIAAANDAIRARGTGNLPSLTTVGPYTYEEDLVPVSIDGATYRLHLLTIRRASERPQPVALITHGSNSASRDDISLSRRLYDPINWHLVGQFFANNGFAAVIFSLRGHGRSEGRFPKQECHVWNQPAEHVRFAGSDFAGVHEWVRTRPWADPTRIVVSGQSTGGAGALEFASRKPGGLIGVVNFAGGYRCNVGPNIWTDSSWPKTLERNDAVRQLWLYGTRDDMIPPGMAKPVADGLPFVTLVTLPGVTHNAIAAIADWRNEVTPYLRSVLRSSAPARPGNDNAWLKGNWIGTLRDAPGNPTRYLWITAVSPAGQPAGGFGVNDGPYTSFATFSFEEGRIRIVAPSTKNEFVLTREGEALVGKHIVGQTQRTYDVRFERAEKK